MTALAQRTGDPALMDLCEAAARRLSTAAAEVNLLDERQQRHAAAWPAQRMAEEPVVVEQTGCQVVVAAGQPVAIPDTREHPVTCVLPWAVDGTWLSYLGVPIWEGGRIVGTLCVVDTRTRDWTAADVALLVRLGQAAGLAVTLTRARDLLAAERTDGPYWAVPAVDGWLGLWWLAESPNRTNAGTAYDPARHVARYIGVPGGGELRAWGALLLALTALSVLGWLAGRTNLRTWALAGMAAVSGFFALTGLMQQLVSSAGPVVAAGFGLLTVLHVSRIVHAWQTRPD